MGEEKAWLKLGGESLLEIARRAAAAVAENIFVVGAKEKFGAEAVEDLFSGQGPLAGIHAALRHSRSEWNLLLAVDMPRLTPEFLRYLLRRAEGATELAVVPRNGRGWQPLCAFYRRGFAAPAEAALRAGRNKIDGLFEAAGVEAVTENEMRAAGFDAEALLQNINTPADWASIRNTLEPGER